MAETNSHPDSEPNIQSVLERAIAHHREGELSKAEWAYQEVLELDPHHPDALHLLGVIAHHLGDTDTAIERVQASLDSNPQQPRALNNLGNIFAAAKRPDEAIETYQKAIDLKPDYTEAIHNLGNVFNELDRLNDSIECFQRAIELVHDDAVTWSALGAAYEKLAQFDEAIEAYLKARSFDEESVDVLSRLGTVYRKLDRMEDAKEAYQQWLSIKPDDPIANHLLHACSESEETPERASAEYVKSAFDGFAEEFDSCLADLGYQVPEMLGERAKTHFPRTETAAADNADNADTAGRTILDLGCGTGLCAQSLRGLADRLVGVDLSPNMLFYANQRESYDELAEADLVDFLTEKKEPYHLILSADTLLYLGDLRPTFVAAAEALVEEGLLIFSLEKLIGDAPESGYTLGSSGRYTHTESCIRGWLDESGFDVIQWDEATLRNEGMEAITGFLVVARKPHVQ